MIFDDFHNRFAVRAQRALFYGHNGGHAGNSGDTGGGGSGRAGSGGAGANALTSGKKKLGQATAPHPYTQGGAGATSDPISGKTFTPSRSLNVNGKPADGGDDATRLQGFGKAPTPGRPEYDNPTLGQVASALQIGMGIFGGGVGLVGGLGNAASETGDDTNRTLVGKSIDDATGQVAGPPDRYGSYPEGRTSDSRGDDDTRLLDRAASAATAAMVGDSTGTDTGTLYSDVSLLDRRKPYSTMSNDELMSALRVA